jgi:hypothetical protein
MSGEELAPINNLIPMRLIVFSLAFVFGAAVAGSDVRSTKVSFLVISQQ